MCECWRKSPVNAKAQGANARGDMHKSKQTGMQLTTYAKGQSWASTGRMQVQRAQLLKREKATCTKSTGDHVKRQAHGPHTSLRTMHPRFHIYIYMYISIYVHICCILYLYIHMCTQTNIYICIHVAFKHAVMYMYIYIYVQIAIHCFMNLSARIKYDKAGCLESSVAA